MCEPATQNLIEEVVTEKVDADELFTAFDISLAVQDRAKATGVPTERHRHMKNSIHTELQQYLDTQVYSRSLQDVGAPTQAFVYYPTGSDPSAYVPRSRSDSSPQPSQRKQLGDTGSRPTSVPSAAPAVSPAGVALAQHLGASSSSDSDDDGDQRDTSGRSPDGRGTLAVPVNVLAAAGFKPYDVAYATAVDYQGKPAISLTKQAVPGKDNLTAYTVDSYGNVRVTDSILQKSGVKQDGSTTYDFESDADAAYVVAH